MSSFRQSQDAFYDHLCKLSDAYYNSDTPLVSDVDFDALVEEFENTYDTKYSYLGSSPTHNKAKLPAFMPSLNKCKDSSAISRFIHSSPNDFISFTYSEKLDGVSLMIQYNSEKNIKLYTRGNGSVGTDVSHLLRYITLPSYQQVKKVIPPNQSLLVRGELVLPKQIGDSNLRNMVSGVVNAKTPNVELLKQMHFVAYSLPLQDLYCHQALARLQHLGFRTPIYLVREICTIELCNEIYDLFTSSSLYTIDGVVVAKDTCDIVASKDCENPRHMMAFKRTNATRTTRVVEVIWQHSRYGTSHPKVEIEKIEIDGCIIQFVSGNNARYIYENRIGPGSLLEIQRSGEVIPNIVRIIQPAETAQMPQVYTWDGVNIRLPNITREQDIARLVYSMKILGAKGISQSTIEVLYDHGFVSEKELWAASVDDLMKCKGFGSKKAMNTVDALQESRRNLTLDKLLLISANFDCFGERKLLAIMSVLNVYEYLLDPKVSDVNLKNLLAQVSIKSQVDDFIQGCKNFRSNAFFMDLLKEIGDCKMEDEPPKMHAAIRVVCTGFRPQGELKDWCVARGIETSDSNVSKHITCVVTKEPDSTSSKAKAAHKIGLPVYTIDEFRARFERML